MLFRILARVLAAECGPIGGACPIAVATTMQARLEAGVYGDTLAEVVDRAYFADGPATSDSFAAAWALATDRLPAGPLLHMWSEDDRWQQGWHEWDVRLTDGTWTIYLSRRAP